MTKIAPDLPKDHIMVMNLCGRGDKDIFTVAEAPGLRHGLGHGGNHPMTTRIDG